MSERRFVVEITHPVPAEEVAGVAALVAQRLDMDPQRIVTLLSGRVGAVTKAVLPDKAIAIADVFSAAGVQVAVLPAALQGAQRAAGDGPGPEPAAGPTPPPAAEAPRAEQRGDADDRGAVPDDDAGYAAGHPASYAATDEAPYEAPYEEPQQAPYAAYDDRDDEPADDPRSTASGERSGRWPAALGWEDEPGVGVWQAPLRDDDDEAADRARVDRADPDPHGADLPEGDRSGMGLESYSHGTVDDAGDLGSGPRSWGERYGAGAEAEEEADRLGPRVPEGGVSPFSTSTRWVPSPHDEYGFDPGEVPLVPGDGQATASWEEERGWSAGRGAPKVGRDVDFAHLGAVPPREGPRLRVFLMWGLVVSIAVFLLLQFVMADRARSGAGVTAFATGMAAFRKGDFVTALRAWEPEAEDGNPDAQYYLGYMAQNGLGQPWSNARAAGYYRRAAEAGLVDAQLALGDLYLRGMGVELDDAKGAALYARAAATGDPKGRFEYGKLLLHGKGVARDPAAALAEFEAAAAGGLAAAADYVAFAREAVGVAETAPPPEP